MKEKYGYEIIAALVDVGRMKDVEGLRQRALTAGAAESVVIDAQGGVPHRLRFPGAQGQRSVRGPVPAALGSFASAHRQEDGRGGPPVRGEVLRSRLHRQGQRPGAYRRVGPLPRPLHHGARPCPRVGHDPAGALDYLAARGIELPLTKKNPYSIDENLWGRAIECGELEDPWAAAPDDAFQFTVDPEDAPDEAEEVVVGFEAGIPVSLDGEAMGPCELVETLDKIGGAHGFGRVDMVENRLVGIKSREVYEVAGSLSLIMAHRELEDLTLTRELQHFKTGIDQRLTELIYDGLWFSPLADALRAFIDKSQEHVSGEVRLRYYKGSCQPVGRRSPNSLYVGKLATYGLGDTFSHESAVGFIQLWGLPLEVWARKRRDGFERRPVTSGGTAKPWGGRFEPTGSAVRASERVDPVRQCAGAVRHRRGRRPMCACWAPSACYRGRAGSDPGGSGRNPGEVSKGAFSWTLPDEDIHMAIERRLTELMGPVGGKMHTGRSRNDQVILDLQLYLRGAVSGHQGSHRATDGGAPAQARDSTKTSSFPGYTHIQRAQPVVGGPPPAGLFLRAAARLANACRVVETQLMDAASAPGPWPA